MHRGVTEDAPFFDDGEGGLALRHPVAGQKSPESTGISVALQSMVSFDSFE
jgi:hypothetical protein